VAPLLKDFKVGTSLKIIYFRDIFSGKYGYPLHENSTAHKPSDMQIALYKTNNISKSPRKRRNENQD
jgi:hypothetical protein